MTERYKEGVFRMVDDVDEERRERDMIYKDSGLTFPNEGKSMFRNEDDDGDDDG